jgi:16S rRNA (guanine966-N2)-methyltransferase
MRGRREKRSQRRQDQSPPAEATVGVRIIGGLLRGRKLRYSGDPRTRPMKDRVREAVFNLVGPAIKGKHAIDLFAGTGALGVEALSRGAVRATFLERHIPTAKQIERVLAELDMANAGQVFAANTFLWFARHPDLGPDPWVLFCSPPYDFYVERPSEMLQLIGQTMRDSPSGSLLVVEADERFDFAQLPSPEEWDIRTYPPAVVGIYRRLNSGVA